MSWSSDFFFYFFPHCCLVCGKPIPKHQGVLCLLCEHRLPRVRFEDPVHNPVCQTFWGRVPVEAAISLFHFEKGSACQRILHELKYKGNRNAGIYLGRLLADELRHSVFKRCDLIIPVPLHRKRQIERGYNQAELIARGAAEILQLPLVTNYLRRCGKHRSQTSMKRYERFENVRWDFELTRAAKELDNKYILLIDDVLTTGATLEACSLVLLEAFSCHICLATVAYA